MFGRLLSGSPATISCFDVAMMLQLQTAALRIDKRLWISKGRVFRRALLRSKLRKVGEVGKHMTLQLAPYSSAQV